MRSVGVFSYKSWNRTSYSGLSLELIVAKMAGVISIAGFELDVIRLLVIATVAVGPTPPSSPLSSSLPLSPLPSQTPNAPNKPSTSSPHSSKPSPHPTP